jgi:mRNA interferase MazF
MQEQKTAKDIRRGDIFYIDGTGHPMSGMAGGFLSHGARPAIIVSNDVNNGNSSPVVEVVFLTTAEKKSIPTHAAVSCKKPSTAMCEQVVTVTKDMLKDFAGHVTAEEQKNIDRCLAISLGLPGIIPGACEGREESTSDACKKLQDLIKAQAASGHLPPVECF